MHTDRTEKSRFCRLVPDGETILISALVFCAAAYGRYHRTSGFEIWFLVLLFGYALFLLPKVLLLFEKGSKGWGLHNADAASLSGLKIFYKGGYVLMGLGILGLGVVLLT